MKHLIIICALIFATNSFCQTGGWEPLTREIKVEAGDSIIKARIFINQSDIVVKDANTYYWYSKGHINKNMGGYFGDLLHGEYIVLTKNSLMITKGQLDSGLRSGTWRRWYENGNLKRIENWKEGRLDGKMTLYSEDGQLVKEVEYKDGVVVFKEDKSFKIINLNRQKQAADSVAVDSVNNN